MKIQEHTLINEGSAREIYATLPKMSRNREIHAMLPNMSPHLHPSEGNKHTIPVALPKTCWIASMQYLLYYPKCVGSKHAILATLPEIYGTISMQYYKKHVLYLYLSWSTR